jgi:hypothetical protein
MAKWKVEQRTFDPATEIWSGDGLWEVQAKTAEEALEQVFVVHLDKAEELTRFIPLSQKELYGIYLAVDRKAWSVRPAGSGVPG